MKRRIRHHGFSLSEVLLAAGILVIGFLLICGALPVGIHLTARGTERTIAAVVADEAFAKVRLAGVRPLDAWPDIEPRLGVLSDPNYMVSHVNYTEVSSVALNPDYFAYPSTDLMTEDKKYYWSALLRHNVDELGDGMFHVTVLVSRTTGGGVMYPRRDRFGPLPNSRFVEPVLIAVEPYNADPADENWPFVNCIRILTMPTDPAGPLRMITDDSVLVDDRNGRVMRVVERRRITGNVNDPPVIFLDGFVFDADIDREGQPDDMRYVWVVPPAVGGGRYPGVAVYQRMIKFK